MPTPWLADRLPADRPDQAQVAVAQQLPAIRPAPPLRLSSLDSFSLPAVSGGSRVHRRPPFGHSRFHSFTSGAQLDVPVPGSRPVHSHSLATSLAATTHATAGPWDSSSRTREASPPEHDDIYPPSYPTSSKFSSRAHQPRPSHARSISQPFPSLYPQPISSSYNNTNTSNNNKNNNNNNNNNNNSRRPNGLRPGRSIPNLNPWHGYRDGDGNDDGDGGGGGGGGGRRDDGGHLPLDAQLSMSKLSKKPQNARGHRHGASTGSHDYMTGNCMTCGSLMRWPRGLNTFRCAICVAINDLGPRDSSPPPRKDHLPRPSQSGLPNLAPPLLDQPGHAETPISLEYTRALIDQCLRNFLRSALAEPRRSRRASASHPSFANGAPQYPPPPPPVRGTSVSPAENKARASAVPSGSYFEIQRKPLPDHNSSRPCPEGTTPSAFSNHSACYSSSGPMPRSNSFSYPDGRPVIHNMAPPPFAPIPPPIQLSPSSPAHPTSNNHQPDPRPVFRQLEEYLVCSFSCPNLNRSFLERSPTSLGRRGSQTLRRRPSEQRNEPPNATQPIADVDAKLLLIGDFAENGSWWTGGGQEGMGPPRRSTSSRSENGPSSCTSMRSANIVWPNLENWYAAVVDAGRTWTNIYAEIIESEPALAVSVDKLQEIESQILAAQDHVQRRMLKASENVLKRPGQPITEPRDLRFLLIVLANPMLYAGFRPFPGEYQDMTSCSPKSGTPENDYPSRGSGPASGHHSGIIKRILGIIANASSDCHKHLVTWFARYPEPRLSRIKDLVSGFLAYRLTRQNDRKQDVQIDVAEGLIPSLATGRSVASLHAALGQVNGSGTLRKKQSDKPPKILYRDDWQIKVAAQVMGLLFAANNVPHGRQGQGNQLDGASAGKKHRVQARGQMLPTSDFYFTLLDDSDLVGDFEAWESRRGKFSFCQYPFLLSIWAKIRILEHDERRQMQNKARDAFFDSIMTHRNVVPYLVLNVRRECLVEDSLKAVGEVIGAGGEDIKKGLRIVFKGEEGVDAGGLRKEWFLLLVREVFNPDHGLFIYDEESRYCYFNPHALEPSEQFFLVGLVFGLAIYNSTILDVALPPFAFRKLMAAAPQPGATSGAGQHHAPLLPRPVMTYTLDDLAEYQPRVAASLRKLLEYDGDVETTFCLNFMISADRYGSCEQVPLCTGGEKRPVTNANRREFVDLYVRHVLDVSVARQFEPFKRGFFTVCGGNALSLFRPEEIELLVRGSEEPLDIESLKMVASYEGWDSSTSTSRRPSLAHATGSQQWLAGTNASNASRANGGTTNGDASGGGGSAGVLANTTNNSTTVAASQRDPVETEPTLRWFWESFERASPQDQRRLLLFVTGSDRIPAMGAASLSIRVSCLGDDCGRFPTTRTCFNTLALWRCATRERLEHVLWTAVRESEGFGLK